MVPDFINLIRPPPNKPSFALDPISPNSSYIVLLSGAFGFLVFQKVVFFTLSFFSLGILTQASPLYSVDRCILFILISYLSTVNFQGLALISNLGGEAESRTRGLSLGRAEARWDYKPRTKLIWSILTRILRGPLVSRGENLTLHHQGVGQTRYMLYINLSCIP